MTPYDTALRLQRRQVDALRIEIAVALDASLNLERSRETIADRLDAERDAFVRDWWAEADAWRARMRAEGLRLAERQQLADARLAGLRAQAAEAYAAMHVLDGAAERHREAEARALAAAEQAAIDDIAATRFARAWNRQRRLA